MNNNVITEKGWDEKNLKIIIKFFTAILYVNVSFEFDKEKIKRWNFLLKNVFVGLPKFGFDKVFGDNDATRLYNGKVLYSTVVKTNYVITDSLYEILLRILVSCGIVL